MKTLLKTLLTGALLVSITSISAHAAVLAAYSFTTGNAGAAVPATTVDPDATATALDYASVALQNTQFGLMANSTGATDLSSAISTGSYYTFSITPIAGEALTLDSVDLSGSRFTNSAGPTTFALESSATGFTAGDAISGGTFTIVGPGYSVTNGVAVSLSPTDFTDLTSTVEFRLYYYGAGTTSQDAGFFDTNTAPLTINGSVSPATPEPASYALMGLGLASLIWFARRRAQA